VKIVWTFIAGVGLAGLVLALLPIPERARYDTLNQDAARLRYVYQRIVDSKTAIDIAFVGTSHIMNGVDDRDIERRLRDRNVDLKVANLGVIMPGRDLQLLMVRKLIDKKTPRLIVVEVDEHEPPYGHALAPYVEELTDVFCCKFFLDAHFPMSLLTFLQRQAVNIPLFFRVGQVPMPATIDEFGWMPIDRVWPAASTASAGVADTLQQRVREWAYRKTAWYGIDVVRRIKNLAQQNGIDVAFIYLPEYAYAGRSSVDLRYYQALGSMILPPQEVVSNSLNYADGVHLNADGAKALVPFLAEQIAGLVIPPTVPAGPDQKLSAGDVVR
jgi:hypothetical protein